MGIKIVADRMIDLSPEELERLNISTIGCYVNIGSKGYTDMEDITPEDIVKIMGESKAVPKTAAKSPEAYEEFFKPFVENGDSVIHFATSSGISSICANAKIAAKRFPGKVFVVDTLLLSGGILHLAMYAIDLIRNGETDAGKIADAATALIPCVQASFLLDKLDLLYKGGRCSGFTYFGANVLKIKPVIYMNQSGQMKVREKFKGNFNKALERYIEATFIKYPDPVLKNLYITYAFENKEIEELIVKTVTRYHAFENIQFNKTGCNCFIHSGKNAIGMFYIYNAAGLAKAI